MVSSSKVVGDYQLRRNQKHAELFIFLRYNHNRKTFGLSYKKVKWEPKIPKKLNASTQRIMIYSKGKASMVTFN